LKDFIPWFCCLGVPVILIWLGLRSSAKSDATLKQEEKVLATTAAGSAEARQALRQKAQRLFSIQLGDLPAGTKVRMETGAQRVADGYTFSRDFYLYFTSADGDELDMKRIISSGTNKEEKLRRFVLLFNKHW
jgi:hypothetical protein